ncbi:MAG: hypothetical protein AB8B97_11510 [Granulosicoccus sp.]
MSVNRVLKATVPISMVILLSSCSDGLTDLDLGNSTEPSVGAANGTTDSANGFQTETSGQISAENPAPAAGKTIQGRVADGYIQGATVCVDINSNESCDDDEPSAMTGTGGLYDLIIPVGAEDKPIVANIPAAAIDEDTGEAIGQPLVFIAPADHPEFISPITTLVHQELQSNPSLEIEEAENAVKTLLGVRESDVSLFDDYVSGGREVDSDVGRQDNFRYLHDTARVVTSMMKEIELDVGAAAQSKGIDVFGSDEAQQAIRDIVRQEVKQLLPAIAEQVTTIVVSGAAVGIEVDTGSGSDTDTDTGFNPDQIAQSLKPASVGENVQSRIDAVIDRVDAVQADMQQLLSDGIYWMEFECNYRYYVDTPEAPGGAQGGYYPDFSPVSETTEGEGTEAVPYLPPEQPREPTTVPMTPDAEVLADQPEYEYEYEYELEGQEAKVREPQRCVPLYGKVQLNAAGDEVISQLYEFDSLSATWVEVMGEGDEYSDFVLVDGEWQVLTYNDGGPQGSVAFAADGSAVIASPEGAMQLKAFTRDLGATSVEQHFLSDIVDPVWFDKVQPADYFPAGAQSHLVSVKQTKNPYVLFNVQPFVDSTEESCAIYADNCNVLGSWASSTFVALQTLADVRQVALQGMELTAPYSGVAPGTVMKFMTAEDAGTSLPTSGLIKWSYEYAERETPAGAGGTEYGGDDGGNYGGETRVDYEVEYGVEPGVDYGVEYGVEPGVDYGVEYGVEPGVDFSVDSEFAPGVDSEVEYRGEDFYADSELRQEICPQVTGTGIDTPAPEQGQGPVERPTAAQPEPVGESDGEVPAEGLVLADINPVPTVGATQEFPEEEKESQELPYYPTIDTCTDISAQTGAYPDGSESTSTWNLITVNGVEMIEIQIPALFRFNSDDEEQAMLLAEHEGFVRLGARMVDSFIDRVVTYNEAAVTTLRGIVTSSSLTD